MLQKSQILLLFLFLITESSYQKDDTQKDSEHSKPLSSKSNPHELTKDLGEHQLETTNLTSKPPTRKKEPITISNRFAGNNGKIHKLYYVIPESGGSSHRKKTHEVKVRLRARRHSGGDGKRWRHQRQKRDLTRKWRVQRLKRELAAATLDNVDRKWSEPQRRHGAITSADMRQKYDVEKGATNSADIMWRDSRQMRDGSYADTHHSVDEAVIAANPRERYGSQNDPPHHSGTWRDSQQTRDRSTNDADTYYSVDRTPTNTDTQKHHDVENGATSSGRKVSRESRQMTYGTSSYTKSHYSVGVDTRNKHDLENEAPDDEKMWRESQQVRDGGTNYADSHYSVDGTLTGVDTRKQQDVENEPPNSSKMSRDSRQMGDAVSDADMKSRERQPERNKSPDENTSDADKSWRQGRNSNLKVLDSADKPPSESKLKNDLQVGTPNEIDGKKFEWRQSKEIVIDEPDDADRWPKQESDSGVPTYMDVSWRERMRSRTPRHHKFVTKSQLNKIDRVMNEDPAPVIKVYSTPEENISKILRVSKSRDFTYSRAPTKRIIYYATLPEIIRRPAAPEWLARHSSAFGQRGIGSSFSNSLLSPFPSGPGQGTADIARIQSALMDVRPPRDNLTPQSPQFTVVDIDRYPSLNDITSTNSVQSSGSPPSGSGQSLSDSGATEGPTSINSLLPQLNNNFLSSLVTPLQMNTPFNGYQPAPYYPGPFPTRHHRFPLPMDGYRPYIASPNGLTVPNSLGNLANYKIDHPGGFYNSGLSNLLSPTKYPYYYDYTSSRVDPLKNHLLFSPSWGAAGPPLYERLTPSTHSSHSVVIDSQSININANNVTTGNSTRITPPVITNVTEHYESHQK